MKPPVPPSQRGVALLITLVALVALMAAGVALIRSFDVSSVQAGNLAFKRDLKNRAERGVLAAQTALSTGALATEAARNANLPAQNYSSTRLASDAESGIPSVLLMEDAGFTGASMSLADLTDATDATIKIRYVIDRQCVDTGPMVSSKCVVSTDIYDQAKDNRQPKVKGEARPIYRISVRATGPRNTQVFIQQTVVR